jgi:3-methyladenine DNA glycosylase/8-oxoguanine DNA glycosylase
MTVATEMEEVAERWRPYRSLAVSYRFASEFEEPR